MPTVRWFVRWPRRCAVAPWTTAPRSSCSCVRPPATHQRDDEHQWIGSAFETRVTSDSADAYPWGSLAGLYLAEHTTSSNVVPDSLRRSLQAGQRGVELDPTCHSR